MIVKGSFLILIFPQKKNLHYDMTIKTIVSSVIHVSLTAINEFRSASGNLVCRHVDLAKIPFTNFIYKKDINQSTNIKYALEKDLT